MAEKSFLCEFLTMSSKRNRETGSCDDETGVKKICHQVFKSERHSVAPVFETKDRSTHTVPRVSETWWLAGTRLRRETATALQ